MAPDIPRPSHRTGPSFAPWFKLGLLNVPRHGRATCDIADMNSRMMKLRCHALFAQDALSKPFVLPIYGTLVYSCIAQQQVARTPSPCKGNSRTPRAPHMIKQDVAQPVQCHSYFRSAGSHASKWSPDRNFAGMGSTESHLLWLLKAFLKPETQTVVDNPAESKGWDDSAHTC